MKPGDEVRLKRDSPIACTRPLVYNERTARAAANRPLPGETFHVARVDGSGEWTFVTVVGQGGKAGMYWAGNFEEVRGLK